MNTDKYKSVAVKTEIVNRLDKLAQLDVRSIPKTIEFLVNKHLNYVKDLEQFKVPYTGGDSALSPDDLEEQD